MDNRVSSSSGFYYGDQWLQLRDSLSMLTRDEIYMFQFQTQMPLIPENENELVYLNGVKKKLAIAAIGFHQVNKCLRENPDKYKPIFEKKGMIIDYSKLNQKPKDKELTMFR